MKTKNIKSPFTMAAILFSISLAGVLSANAFTAENENFQNGFENGRKVGRFLQKPGPRFFQNIDRQVEKIENGIVMTITSEDTEVVEKIQNHEPRARKNHENVEVEKVNLENGVQVTITSDDPETVERIQNRENRARGRRGAGFFAKNIDRQMEKIENGIVMTITSEDAEVVEKIQNHEPRARKNHENVEVEKVNLENGVQVTITSDDPETVERIQNRADRPRGLNPRGRGGRMGMFLSEEDREAVLNMSPEERKEFFQIKKEKWQNMSDEEKQIFREQRKENIKARGFGRGRAFGQRFGQGRQADQQ